MKTRKHLTRSCAEAFWSILVKNKVQRVFGIPGGKSWEQTS